MDPQLNSQPDKIDEAVMSITTVEEPTQPTVMAPIHSKSNKKFIIMGVAALVLIVLVAVGIFIVTQMNNVTKKAQTSQTTSQAAPATPIEAATNELTQGAVGEMTITDTDDSADVGDASTAASNVGDSVNENNL
jgi:uncharacterized protein HemX